VIQGSAVFRTFAGAKGDAVGVVSRVLGRRKGDAWGVNNAGRWRRDRGWRKPARRTLGQGEARQVVEVVVVVVVVLVEVQVAKKVEVPEKARVSWCDESAKSGLRTNVEKEPSEKGCHRREAGLRRCFVPA
jgi:hypothetical protein